MKHPYVYLLGILAFATSCSNSKPYDMLTVVQPNGSIQREFTVEADTSFMLGDTNAVARMLPIDLDNSWKITWKTDSIASDNRFPLNKNTLDSLLKTSVQPPHFVVSVQKDFQSVEQLASDFKLSAKNSWKDLKVNYALTKSFRWFYTYYTYRETYPKIQSNFTTPLTHFMSEQEATFWLKGETDILSDRNGFEIREYTGEIEDKFNQWLSYNIWSQGIDIVAANYSRLKNPPVNKEDFLKLKDSIFIQRVKANPDVDFTEMLNAYFKTKAFSSLDKNLFENILDKSGILSYSDVQFKYRLRLPGTLTSKPAFGVIQDNEVIWKLSSERLLLNGLSLEASSRKANLWAFLISGIIVLAAGWKLFRHFRKRNV